MAATSHTMRATLDTWTDSLQPSIAHPDGKNLGVESGSAYTWIYFPFKVPLGATVTSATLRLYSRGLWTATSRTISVQRASSRFIRTVTTWNDQPGVTGAVASLVSTGNADGYEYAIDVAPQIQAVASGADWYGFRVSVTSVNRRYFYSSDALDFRPTLDVSWSTAPFEPESLRPSGGRATSLSKPVLRFDFTDDLGDTTMAALQVQINATNVFTAPTFDSGTVTATEPELDLSTTAYAGLTVGSTAWWRVRVQDGSGLWSGWSDATSFTRDTHGVLTITNPAASPNNFVTEFTPPFAWTFTGETQEAYRVQLVRDDDPTVILGDGKGDTGRVKSTAVAWTPPKGVLTKDTDVARVRVFVWDTKDREDVPGDKPYVLAERTFTVNESATTAPVTTLAATEVPLMPWVDITWNRSTAPDSFTIKRDGDVIDSGLVPSDLLVSGTSYTYRDKEVGPRRSHTWVVLPVVGGKISASNPTVSKNISPDGIYLTDTERDIIVLILGTDPGTWAMNETAETYTPLGATRSVRITQTMGGYTGSIVGTLQSTPRLGLVANEWEDRMLRIKGRPGETLVLSVGNLSIKVVVGNIVVAPAVGYPDVKSVSFDFWQVGKLNYDLRL